MVNTSRCYSYLFFYVEDEHEILSWTMGSLSLSLVLFRLVLLFVLTTHICTTCNLLNRKSKTSIKILVVVGFIIK